MDMFANRIKYRTDRSVGISKLSRATEGDKTSECFDFEMCALTAMNELNHVAARLHSWAWSTAASELRDG